MRRSFLFLLITGLLAGCVPSGITTIPPDEAPSKYGAINRKGEWREARVFLKDGTEYVDLRALHMERETTTWINPDEEKIAVPTSTVQQVAFEQDWTGRGMGSGLLLGGVIGAGVGAAALMGEESFADGLVVAAASAIGAFVGMIVGGAAGATKEKDLKVYRFYSPRPHIFQVNNLSCEVTECPPIRGELCYAYRCDTGEAARKGQFMGLWQNRSEVEQEVARRLQTEGKN